MSYVQPNSVIQLFRGINLDNRYMHTIYFASASAQNTWFTSKVAYTYNAQSYTRYTRNQVKLKADATQIMDCTYLRFMNDRTTDMWYYAFINSVEYINENTALVTYEIDVMQTWFIQKGSVRPCMIRREHSLEDGLTANLEPEPIGSDSYQYEFIDDCNTIGENVNVFNNMSVVANTTGRPSNYPDIGGLYSGTKYTHNECNLIGDYSDVTDMLDGLIGSWDVEQRQEEVLNLFTFPTFFCTHNGAQKTLDATPVYANYTPKNKKLMSYPYSYLFCTTQDGDASQYRWEFFKHPYPNEINFEIYGNMNGGGQIICYPRKYMGVEDNIDVGVTMDDFPKNAFNYDAYQAWVASGGKTKLENAQKILTAKGVNNILSDIGNAANTMVQGGASVEGALSSSNASPANITSSASGALNASLQAGARIANTMLELKEAQNKIDYQWKDVMYKPNETVGKSMSSVAVANRKLNFYFYNAHVIDDEMRRLDDFFSMYGYAVNHVKYPNLTGRQYWNFVQTENCVIAGNMPASSKEAIARIFDGGITFWHNGDNVGNYGISITSGSINNPIVS